MKLQRKIFAVLLLMSCVALAAAQSVTKESYGKTSTGENVDLYSLCRADVFDAA